MTTPPIVKRRRLNNPNINKPFRSPFRTVNQVDGPEPTTSIPTAPDCAQSETQSSAEISQPSEFSPSPTMSTKSQPTPRTPAPLAPTLDSRHVASSIVATRATVSTLQQALKILEDPGRSEQLEALAERWRGAARLAADAVYAGARDRVNQAGGVGVWRESERERAEWRRQQWWDGGGGGGGERRDDDDRDGDAAGHNASEEGHGGGGCWDEVHDGDVRCWCPCRSGYYLGCS
jgi:Swi5-dependent recombination DNA repair protein 1